MLLPTETDIKFSRELTLPKLSDEELLTVSIQRDPKLYEQLVERYRDAFIRKAESILKDTSDAEDAVQETFVKIYLKGNKFRPIAGASFRSWAYRILINTCLTQYRKNARQRQNVVEGDLEEGWAEVAVAHESGAVMVYDEFLSVVSRLPLNFANVLREMVIFGKSIGEVAQKEGVSLGAMRTRLHRARRAFEKVKLGLI